MKGKLTENVSVRNTKSKSDIKDRSPGKCMDDSPSTLHVRNDRERDGPLLVEAETRAGPNS